MHINIIPDLITKKELTNYQTTNIYNEKITPDNRQYYLNRD